MPLIERNVCKSVDAEIQSDLARYLCVLVSGFVETAVAELAIEHCQESIRELSTLITLLLNWIVFRI